MRSQRLIVIAILLGVAAVLLVNAQFNKLKAKVVVPKTTFYRAAKDVLPGVSVQAARKAGDLVAVKSIPKVFARAYPFAIDEAEYEIWAKEKILRPIHAGREFLHADHLKDHVLRRGDTGTGARLADDRPRCDAGVLEWLPRHPGRQDRRAPGHRDERLRGQGRQGRHDEPGRLRPARPGRRRGLREARPVAAPARLRGRPYSTVTLAGPPNAISAVRTARQTGKKLELSLTSSRNPE